MRTKKNRDVPVMSGLDVPVPDPAAIGMLIRARRRESGLTLQEVSDGTGLSMSFVHAVEHGKTTAEIGKVLHLMAMLGIDLFGRPRR